MSLLYIYIHTHIKSLKSISCCWISSWSNRDFCGNLPLFFPRAVSAGGPECYLGKKKKTNKAQHVCSVALAGQPDCAGVWRLRCGRAAPSEAGVVPVPTGLGGTAQAKPLVQPGEIPSDASRWPNPLKLFFGSAVPPAPLERCRAPSLPRSPCAIVIFVRAARQDSPCGVTSKVTVPSKWQRLCAQLFLHGGKGPGFFPSRAAANSSLLLCSRSLPLTTTRCWKYEIKLIFLT